MSELRFVSPLMDGMTVEKEFPGQNGRSSYTLRHNNKKRYALKHLSIPASDSQIRALILSGAYADEDAVHEYYGKVVSGIQEELDAGKALASSGCFAAAISYQIEPKESGVGYDVYILYPLYVPLSVLLTENAITNLRAINLGLDLCDAVAACRNAGYIFENLKPENIFLTPGGKFLLGDLGLAPLEDLKYACIPEEYIGPFSAPELSDITASPNTTIDLYSIGMVLYRVYNGNHGPFEDENTGEGMADKLRLTGKPLPTPIFADYELSGIILKACAFQQEERFTSPEELRQVLLQYMQRNEISDTLIVPPIVASYAPVEEESEGEEPIRMTSAEELDDTFRQSFAPDTTGGGTAADIDEAAMLAGIAATVASVEAEAEEPEAQASVAPETAQEEAPEEEAPAQEPIPEEETLPPLVAPEAEKTAPSAESEEAPAQEAAPEDGVEKDPEAVESPAVLPPLKQPQEIDELDADQMDLDELLASVSEQKQAEEAESEVAEDEDSAKEDSEETGRKKAPWETVEEKPRNLTMRFEEAKPAKHSYTDHRPPVQEAPAKPQKKSFPRWLQILIIGLLLLAIGLVTYFLSGWFFVEAAELRLQELSIREFSLELVTGDDPSGFVLSCSDSHGNSYPATVEGRLYTFSGLDELTTYTITVEAAKFHRLTSSSISLHKVTTPEATEITQFDAARGENDGDVLLTFKYEGPAPSQWVLSYEDSTDAPAETVNFEGDTCLLSGLSLNETYTFTLLDTENCFMSGLYSIEYGLLPLVEATELNVGSIEGSDVTVTWEAGENLPEEWIVTCEAEGMETVTQSVTQTQCLLSLPDLSRDYTISVDALGMDSPTTLVLPADPIIISDLTAEAGEDGTIRLTWQAPAGAPVGGWYVSYNPVNSLHNPYMLNAEDDPIRETSVTLEHLVPNCDYEISLNLSQADAAQPIFGETKVAVKTPAAEPFSGFGISPKAPYTTEGDHISLWLLPEKEDWDYADLSESRSIFSITERIAVCLSVNAVNASSEKVALHYAIRNESGHVVNDIYTEIPWNDMWYSRHHASVIPLPAYPDNNSLPGLYTLEIYVNGRLLGSAGFNIE